MDSILLTSSNPTDVTMVSNIFIDDYMPYAHGDYVKVYLYLLRCLGGSCLDISISMLADRFENTEKDIIRAIQYWEQKGLLKVEHSENGAMTEISLSPPLALKHDKKSEEKKQTTPSLNKTKRKIPKLTAESSSTVISRPVYTPEQIACMKEEPQVTALLSQIETALKRLLNQNDVQLILYLYESLNFSPELILYLYQYCISMNKTHSKYIERVALNWNRDGIHTIKQAEMTSKQYKKEYYTIAKALGFNRALADPECSYVEKWLHEWNFSLDVVLEACKRTVLQTQSQSFYYIDKILESWHKSNVSSIEDIKKEDAVFNNNSNGKSGTVSSGRVKTGYTQNRNRFTAFEQHHYSKDDMEMMERAMLHNAEKKIRKENQYESYK